MFHLAWRRLVSWLLFLAVFPWLAVDAFSISRLTRITARGLHPSQIRPQLRQGDDAFGRYTVQQAPHWRRASSTAARSSSMASSASSDLNIATNDGKWGPSLRKLQSKLVRAGLILYVASMCLALPLTLLPQRLLYKLKIVSKRRKEVMALSTAQFCSRCLLRLVPFCRIEIMPCKSKQVPEPAIWVCNHISMLDVFILLGVDRQLRGGNKRPIKIVYWKGLEANPITALLFKQAGFIPVQMADNGNGNDNEYDVSSFKKLLKDAKEAFKEGFDIGLLPEGQLNPHPEKGLLPVFSGAYTLAKLSRRPIHMMALYGTHHLWHALNGMTCESRLVKVRAYPTGRRYDSANDFLETFSTVVGHFGAHGCDLPDDELRAWLDGSAFAAKASAAAAAVAPASDAPRITTEKPTASTNS